MSLANLVHAAVLEHWQQKYPLDVYTPQKKIAKIKNLNFPWLLYGFANASDGVGTYVYGTVVDRNAWRLKFFSE